MFKAYKKRFILLAMKVKLNIRQKITVYILGTAIILFSITIGYLSTTSKKAAYKNLTELTISQTDQFAITIENWLNSDMAIVRTLSNAFLEHRQLPFEQWRNLIMGMYRQVILANPHLDAVWDSWELAHLDPKWDKPYGREFNMYYRERGRLLSRQERRSLDGDPPVYAAIKEAGKESIIEPYLSSIQKGGFMTSLTSPLYNGGRYVGLVGIDLFLGRFQEFIKEIKLSEGGVAFLLSTKGTFIAHPDSTIFAKNFGEVFPEINEAYRIIERLQKAERFSFVYSNQQGERFFYSFSPVNVGRTQTPWSLGIVVPEATILKEANRSYNIAILLGFISLALFVTIIIILANNITIPIKRTTNLLVDLSKGKIDKLLQISDKNGDEISKMGEALFLSIDGLLAKTEFAKSIGEGKLDTELDLLSEDDVLGKSLLEMRESLRRAQQDEQKRKDEDEKLRWLNEGLAKFGDILRQNNDDMEKLGEEITKNLVWYLKASLGGLFVRVDDSDPATFELVASFAYDRNRYLNKNVEIGEGLVGACAAEKGTIYLTEIPQDYIEVTSGLGGVNPSSLLLIPVTIEGEVLGVIELASLKRFEQFEIEFVEKLGESVASTLRTVKINQKTAELLRKSQEQTEIMVSQEEEMRQNLEELQATQEEAARKTFEMEGLIEALNASSYVMEYDPKGVVININDSYLKLLSLRRDEVIGSHHSDNLVLTDHQRMTYEEFWSNLRKGKIQKQTTKVSIGVKELNLLETYTPIKNISGEVYKILKVSVDMAATSKF